MKKYPTKIIQYKTIFSKRFMNIMSKRINKKKYLAGERSKKRFKILMINLNILVSLITGHIVLRYS